MTALTRLRYQIPSIFPQIVHNDKNPKDYYTLKELSFEISPKNYEYLLNEQLKRGTPSHQLYNIIDVLNIGIKNNKDGCSIAKYKIEKYLESKQWSTSELGNIVHPIYEQLLIEYLESKGIRIAHEKLVSILRGTKPDNTIERKSNAERRSGTKSNFEKYIEDLQSVLTIPDAINLIAVDYTYSSEWDLVIKRKLNKLYQSEDRLLIIVLLGQKNDRDVRNINKKLQEAVKDDDGSRRLENVRIITSEQYGEFLGFNNPDHLLSINDRNFKQRFNHYQRLSFNLFHDMDKLFGAIDQNKRAVSWLEGHHAYEDWVKIYW